MESFRVPEDSSIPRMSTSHRKRIGGEIGMGQGERRGRDKSWSLGCLQGAASSGPAAPLQTSLRLKCFRNTESSSEDVAQPQGGHLRANTSLTCAPAPPAPASTAAKEAQALRSPASLLLLTGPAFSPHSSKGSSASRSCLSSLFCSSSLRTCLQLRWSK